MDVGGSKISGVLFDGHKVIGDYTLSTPRDNFNHLLIMLKAVCEPLLEIARKNKIKVKGVGLGVAGVINSKEGVVLKSPNIAFIDKKAIVKELEKIISLPVRINNDANCFVRAEAKIGAGEKFNNVYGLTLGTGIGGGWWMGGKIYEGAHGAANEVGHMVINLSEKVDLEGAYHNLMRNNPEKVANDAYSGDRLAIKVYEEFGGLLGVSFANIINLLDVEAIIIGGSVAESADLFLDAAKKIMIKYSVFPEAKKIKIMKGKLGALAGAIGAAMIIE